MNRFIENTTELLKSVAGLMGLEFKMNHDFKDINYGLRPFPEHEIESTVYTFNKLNGANVMCYRVRWRTVVGDTNIIVKEILDELKTCMVTNKYLTNTTSKMTSRTIIGSLYGRYSTLSQQYLPTIEKVIFNDPATIIMWADGTKTVVKAVDETYDPEKGMAMAIARKALGNKGNYYDVFEKWLPRCAGDCDACDDFDCKNTPDEERS